MKHIRLIIMAALAVFVIGACVASTVPGNYVLNSSDALAPNLAFAYLFNAGTGTVAKDFSTYANNGSFNTSAGGSAAITWASDGTEGEKITLTPSGTIGSTAGAYVNIPSSAQNNIETSTIAVRFKTSAAPGGGYAFIIAKQNGSAHENVTLWMDWRGGGHGTSGCLKAELFDGSADVVCQSSSAYDDGAWHTVVIVRTAQSTLQLYVDDVYIASSSDSTSAGATLNSSALALGDSAGTPGAGWQGDVSWFYSWTTAFTNGGASVSGTLTSGQVYDLTNHPTRMWVAPPYGQYWP